MYVASYRKKAAKKGKLRIPNFSGLVILYGANKRVRACHSYRIAADSGLSKRVAAGLNVRR
ncbi:MAG: hypothetical protein ACRD4S_10905 [Candidatus Acidiferrales bacterium]